MRLFATLILVALLALVGCGPKLLPNTEIEDTDENKQVLQVIDAYRRALEGRNVEGILKVVSPKFFEDSGTPDGSDDYNFDGLKQRLTEWAERTKAIRVDVQVKNILPVKDDPNTVKARYFYDVNYQLSQPQPGLPPIWKHDADTKEMTLVKQDGAWKIASGI